MPALWRGGAALAGSLAPSQRAQESGRPQEGQRERECCLSSRLHIPYYVVLVFAVCCSILETLSKFILFVALEVSIGASYTSEYLTPSIALQGDVKQRIQDRVGSKG